MKKLVVILIIVLSVSLIFPLAASAAEEWYDDDYEDYYEYEYEDAYEYDSDDTGQYTVVVIVVIILVSSLISLIVCFVWRGKMKTAKVAKTAAEYIPQGGFRLTNEADTFLYRTVKSELVETQSSSSTSGSTRPPGRGR